jgi:hypothetical protein
MMELVLEILGTNPSTHEFKSLKVIQKDFPQCEYHQLMAVYLQTKGKLLFEKIINRDLQLSTNHILYIGGWPGCLNTSHSNNFISFDHRISPARKR